MKEHKKLLEDRLLMSFYEDPSNRALFKRKRYDTRASQVLDERFKLYYLKARMVSYTDKLTRHYSREFDKQKRFQRNQLHLDTPQEKGEDLTAISLIPDKDITTDDAVVKAIPDILPTETLQKKYHELSEEKKTILTYFVFDRLNNKEIAAEMDCSPQNVSKLKIKALNELRSVEANERDKETSF
ncbi:sigma factor-like helix-turn-helix DNA-binding protein [Shouchella lehensis]|nr:sigma factor-like helix-turn-helix DNA-binding protein [Shouchella lehensis]